MVKIGGGAGSFAKQAHNPQTSHSTGIPLYITLSHNNDYYLSFACVWHLTETTPSTEKCLQAKVKCGKKDPQPIHMTSSPHGKTFPTIVVSLPALVHLWVWFSPLLLTPLNMWYGFPAISPMKLIVLVQREAGKGWLYGA